MYYDTYNNVLWNCRVSTSKLIEFRSRLGINQDDITLAKEQSALNQ